jgi:hypothetical protein
LAVDEESAWCVAVADDAVCANTERGVRELLVGRAPALCVALPAELGERVVEVLGEGGEDVSFVEVGDPGALYGGHALVSLVAVVVEEAVDRACGDLALAHAELWCGNAQPLDQERGEPR